LVQSLKQFSEIQFVKIYDESGRRRSQTGPRIRFRPA